MNKSHQQLVINLDEYKTAEEKMEAIESLMELLDLDFDIKEEDTTTTIVVQYFNLKNDLLHQVMLEFDKSKN